MNLNDEPAMIIGSGGALVGAIIVLLVAFGVPITDTQAKAISAVVTLVVPIAAAWLIRSRVTPNAHVAAQVAASLPPPTHPLDTLVPEAVPITPEVTVVPPVVPH